MPSKIAITAQTAPIASPSEQRLCYTTCTGRVLYFYIGRTDVGWYAVTELGQLLGRLADDAAAAEHAARVQLAALYGPKAEGR